MGDPSSLRSGVQECRLAAFPTLWLQGPVHHAATVRRAWQAIAQNLTERLGLVLPEPVWKDGPECAAYSRGTRLSRIQPESQSVGELAEVVAGKAASLLSLADTAAILADLEQRSPVYAQELRRLEIPPTFVHAVLRLLLTERVSIADIESILDVLLAEWSPGQRPEGALERVRERLGSWLCESHSAGTDELNGVTLAPKVESVLSGKVTVAHNLELEPQAASRFLDALHEALVSPETERPLLVCSSNLRLPLFRLLERGLPGVPVLSWNEIPPDFGVNVLGTLEHRF